MEGTHENLIYCVKKTDSRYPLRFRELPNMPGELFVKGQLPEERKPSVAIVGARKCSPYGRIQAFRYARELSKNGVQIISGMAYGIDTESHKGAMDGGTPTFAVLGCGPDICYPKANQNLYTGILAKGGGIISEYEPGTKPQVWTFPARNRIVSAFADIILIIEARERSGALITAEWALEQGKSVYALPGSVQDELSLGCNKLIYDGAGIAYSPEIILSELGIREENPKKSDRKKKLGLAQDLELVYSCLDLRPKNIDQLVIRTGLSVGKISSILVELSLKGLVMEVGRHHYVKRS